MKREDIRRFQLTQLELLKYVDHLCKEQGFNYYLAWGSLLGAVREHAFIPWDADIDIAMKRADYDRFCEFMMKNPSDKLFLDHYLTEKNHTSPHAVLRIKGTHVVFNSEYSYSHQPSCDGIYIDIFPIDTVPDDVSLQKKQLKKIQHLRNLITYKNAPIYGRRTSTIKRVAKKIVSFCLLPVSFCWINRKVDQAYQMYNHIDSNTVAILTEPEFYPRQTFPKKVFEGVRTAIFEDSEFPIPALAEEFLTIGYGDYLKLPPESERYHFLDDVFDHIDYGVYESGLEL